MPHLPSIGAILFSLFGGFICSLCTYGQVSKADSATQQAGTQHSQVALYFLMSKKFAKNDPDKAWQYLKKGREQAGSDAYLNAQAIFYEAQILTHSDRQLAEKTYLRADQSLAPFHSKEALMLRARALHNYTDLRRLKGDYKTVFSFLTQKIIPLAKAAQDTIYLAQSYAAVGQILMEHEQYKKAGQYYDKALEQLQSRKKNGPLQLAIKITICQNLLRDKQISKAKSLLDELRSHIPSGTALAVRFGLNEGMYYNKISQHQQALQKLITARTLAQKLKYSALVKLVSYYEMTTLRTLKKYAAAQRIASTTFDKSPVIATNKLVIYQHNAANYFQQKKYDSAYLYLEKFSHLKDSLHETRLENEIGALELKFRTQENQKKLAELKSSNLEAKLALSRSRFYIGMFGTATVFLAILAVLLYLYLQKNKKEHAQREQVNSATALLKGQEAERKRVARDLHDDLGGTLTAIKMRFSSLINQDNTQQAEESFNIMLGQLDHSVAKIRQIANNMMPEMLLKLGLEAALKDLCTYYSSDNFHIDFHYIGVSESLTEQHKLTIYRIIQELLTNTVKHAKARQALIQCSQQDHWVFLTYEDDGIGLKQDKDSLSQGLGLDNVKARVAYMNGKIEILSGGTLKGTIFNIELNVSDEISNRHS